MESMVIKDARDCHPTLVFFQDQATRLTVVVERETGLVVGHSPGMLLYVGKEERETPEGAGAARVWREAAGYRVRRMAAR
jgi:hypothetical protein